MSYSFSQVTSADLARFKSLLQVFGDAFADVPTYQHAVPNDAYLAALLDKRDFIALVATDAGAVVGGLAAYVLEKFEQERREIYIYDLAVAEPHRRKGLATGLIRLLQEIARERKAWVIYVQADHGDDPAIKLYESLGTREDVLHFDIPVEE